MIFLDFTNAQTINKKRCPYFFKVKENGNMLSLELTSEAWESLNEYFKGKGYNGIYLNTSSNRLNIYENGKINISFIWYNNRNEEWEEEMAINPSEKEQQDISYAINYMINFVGSIYRCGKPIGKDFNELIKYLKESDF